MGSGSISVSRLTLFFIVVFIISGGVLTYFSISSISNLKELTEKKVLEEKNQLYRGIMDTLQADIEKLTSQFSDQITKFGFVRDSLTLLQQYFPFYSFPFHYLDQGDFQFPYYIQNLKGNFQETIATPYCNYFNLGELAEFSSKEMINAKRNYQRCLALSKNSSDSVRALNALARISVKSRNMEKVMEYYGKIISDYPDVQDPSGYPYSNYSISQLIKQENHIDCNKLLLYAEMWLEEVYENKIPMLNSSGQMIKDIVSWISNKTFKDLEKLSRVEMLIQSINTQLTQIEQFSKLIDENINFNSTVQILKSINGFQFIEYYNVETDYLIALQNEANNYSGFVMDINKFLALVRNRQHLNVFDFKYEIEITKFAASASIENDKHLFQLNPYISGYAVSIKLSNSNYLTEYINMRRWIYGIALTVLLSGMLFAIMLILRDINREKQIASLKSDFISNVTHELKSPITSIRMFAESMLLGRVKNQSRKQEYLETIMRESERLKRMINNILDFSRMENRQQKYRFEEKRLSPLLLDIIDDLDYWLLEKKQKLITEIDDDIFANIDQEKIKQAISNLINNAIKYTPESKNIYIRLCNNGNNNLLEVEDQGIGIPEERKKDIFKKFYRVSAKETEGISGTGLGLSVVKEIIDAHQWEIKVESQLGEGSKFTILF